MYIPDLSPALQNVCKRLNRRFFLPVFCCFLLFFAVRFNCTETNYRRLLRTHRTDEKHE